MASRTTLQEAQELKAKWQAEHPNAKFKIIDNSETMKVGRVAAEMHGYKIIKDISGIMVLAEVTRFDVLEVRQCQCGTEILIVAIGESGLNECQKCKVERRASQAKRQHKSERQSAQRIADWDAMDRWEE